MQKHPTLEPPQEANQTVRLEVDKTTGPQSIRISFTDQRLTAHGGLAIWSHFLQQKRFRKQLAEQLPHAPTSPNAYVPTDVALGFVGGILTGADKLSRVAWLQSDPALAQALGIEAMPSRSTFSRFFALFSQKTSGALGRLHAAALDSLPTRKEGYTLDLDSGSLLHEDGHQEGVVCTTEILFKLVKTAKMKTLPGFRHLSMIETIKAKARQVPAATDSNFSQEPL